MATYYFLHVLAAIVARLSRRTVYTLGNRIGSFAYHHLPVRKEVALNHLEMAFPNRPDNFYQSTLREVYHHFGIAFVEMLAMTSLDFDAFVEVKSREILDEAVGKGKGIILLSGHFGNWEIIAGWLGKKGYQFYPVFRKQKNRGADRFFVEFRRKIGTRPIPSGAPPREMLNVLRKGAILGLVSDQDARKGGVFVNFFGIPSSTPRGAAVFHLKTGASMIMALCHRSAHGANKISFQRIDGHTGVKETVPAITQRFTTILEREIRKHPERYFWFHKRWKTQPPTT